MKLTYLQVPWLLFRDRPPSPQQVLSSKIAKKPIIFLVKLQSATIGPCLLTSFFCYFSGPLGAISSLAAQSSATSEANSAATSRTGSRENLCEECIQNPLDLIDASIQVCSTFYSILKIHNNGFKAFLKN